MLTKMSILMEVANDIVKSQTATNFESQNYIPLVSIIATAIASVAVACYTVKRNQETTKMNIEANQETTKMSIEANQETTKMSIEANQETTKMSIEANLKSLMIQINQVEMRDSIKKLFGKVTTGDIEKIRKFIDSGEGIYIPASLKKAIKEKLKGEMDTEDRINAISDLIDNYISPLLDWKVL